jgi:hypothetical protein
VNKTFHSFVFFLAIDEEIFATEDELKNKLEKNFKSVKYVKPPSSRSDSAEIYLLASDFTGSTATK